MLKMIFACDQDGVIGRNGDLPWRQSTDLKFFKKTTLGTTVVMGRRTWDSVPFPLPGRRNIVISRSQREDVEVMSIEEVKMLSEQENLFIIGGGEIYSAFMPFCDTIYRTVIKTEVRDGDTYAPNINEEDFQLVESHEVMATNNDDFDMIFQTWQRKENP